VGTVRPEEFRPAPNIVLLSEAGERTPTPGPAPIEGAGRVSLSGAIALAFNVSLCLFARGASHRELTAE
jgi:hypothetical protein